MNRTPLAVLAVATTLLGAPFSAVPLVIDDFTADQIVSIGIGPPNPQTQSGTTAGLLGTRQIELSRTAGFGSASADVNATAANAFSLGTGPGVVANATLAYGNFGTVDITDGGTSQLFQFSARADLDAVMTVSLLSAAGTSSFDFAIGAPGTGAGDSLGLQSVRLEDFVGSADLTQIEDITLTISGPASLDLQLDALRTAPDGLRTAPTPEPGAIALFGIGIAVVASRRSV